MFSELMEKSRRTGEGRNDDLYQAMLKMDDDTIQSMMDKMRCILEVDTVENPRASIRCIQEDEDGTGTQAKSKGSARGDASAKRG